MAMVRELPSDERPRERLLQYGPSSLSNSELLAILIRNGYQGKSARDMAIELLKLYQKDGLGGISRVTASELLKIKGIGAAKAAEIVAAVEMGRRLSQQETNNSRFIVRNPEDAAAYAMPRLRYEQQEHFCILILNVKNHIMSMKEITVGTLTASIVHPREVFKMAVQESAAAIILVHNHPSGDPSPSREDISITDRLVKSGNIMDIPVLDHIIVGDNRFISLKEKGLMK